MQTFKIEIQEYLSRIIELEAKNIDDAIFKVKELYQKEDIILDKDDYVTTEINEYTD